MNEIRADLHCHSTYSDGTSTPAELIQLAVARGLKGLSITDHDTACAYPEAFEIGRQHQVEVIPGIEFSASHEGFAIHILGYSFIPSHPAITRMVDSHRLRRKDRNEAILKLLAAHKMLIDPKEIEGHEQGSIGRPHIAAAMVRKGYVDTIASAFKKYLRDGALCFVSGARFSIEETIQTIHEAGGLAVIAHPHLITKESAVKKLVEMDFDGIEAYYGFFNKDQCQKWVDVASRNGWFITGGSDFHGETKPSTILGSSWAPAETFERLLSHHKSHLI